MTITPQALVPMAHVADVERSIAFYVRLGFVVRNTFTPDGASAPSWASLEANRAQLMLALASEPVDPRQQAVLFYLYFDDIRAVHAELVAAGLDPGALTFPFYCPDGEFRMIDPDGYCLMLSHT